MRKLLTGLLFSALLSGCWGDDDPVLDTTGGHECCHCIHCGPDAGDDSDAGTDAGPDAE